MPHTAPCDDAYLQAQKYYRYRKPVRRRATGEILEEPPQADLSEVIDFRNPHSNTESNQHRIVELDCGLGNGARAYGLAGR